MAYKVIQWGTGFTGKMVARELLEHPEFELVAVIVNDPDKDGKDIGELIGIDRAGIACTTDAEAALALDADVVAYFGPTAEFAAVNIENMAKALRSGKDVVSTSMTPLVYPPACPPSMVEALEAACKEGGKSCFTSGIDPGFANDLFPLTLIGLCGRVDSVRIQEILDYQSYTGDYARTMGIGEPMDFKALLENTKVLVFSWGHTIPMIADALGVEIEKYESVYDKWEAPEDIQHKNGVIAKGCCAAVRFEIQGYVKGEPRIVIEHVNRITTAAAPDWPRPKLEDDDCYRVIVKGSPNITQEIAFRGAYDGDSNSGGCLSTGMRAIQAIPAVIAARPGLLSALDLPLIPGVGNMR